MPFAVERLRNFVVVVDTEPGGPTDLQWDEQLAALSAAKCESAPLRGLIYARNAGPTNSQREKLRQVLRDAEGLRGAVVTDSMFVRSILRTVSWVIRLDARVFKLDEVESALTFLQLDPDQSQRARNLLSRVRVAG